MGTGVALSPASYYYQPLKADGTLCTDATNPCVLYNLFYVQESNNATVVIKSEHRQ